MQGAFEVAWFNPWNGNMIFSWSDKSVRITDSKLLFPLPSFEGSKTIQPNATVVRDGNDLAFKLRRK
jgi:hypothetical protein